MSIIGTNVIDGTVIFVGDVSGSIDNAKKDVYRRIVAHYKALYSNAIFISHTTCAKFTDEDTLLNCNESGGTYISSGLKLAIGEVALRLDKDNLVVVMGDGDDWSEDIERTINALNGLTKLCKVVFHEVYPSTYTTTLAYKLRKNPTEVKVYQIHQSDIKELQETIFGEKPRRERLDLHIGIEILGNTTVARMKGKEAYSVCSPTDVYDKDTGIAVAVGRLLGMDIVVE